MSSNLSIQKICEMCGNEFTAQKTTTKCCSSRCSSLAYKQRQREFKIEKVNTVTKQIRTQPIEAIKAKEFLTVRDVATILGYSRHTVYRLIKRGELVCINPGTRMIRVKRSSIDVLIETPISTEPKPKEYDISECYNVGEMQQKYNVPSKTLYDIIKRNDIPKFQRGKYVYVPKELIDKIFN